MIPYTPQTLSDTLSCLFSDLYVVMICVFVLTADVITDERAKMSVAAKMSLFKVSLCCF